METVCIDDDLETIQPHVEYLRESVPDFCSAAQIVSLYIGGLPVDEAKALVDAVCRRHEAMGEELRSEEPAHTAKGAELAIVIEYLIRRLNRLSVPNTALSAA